MRRKTARRALVSGKRLGKYTLKRRIGSGAYSSVWRALDRVEGVDVALKLPHDETLSAAMLREFQAEARLVAGLDHPNILKIKNADAIDGRFVVAYDLGSRSLFRDMRRRLTLQRSLHVMRSVLQGLAYAHRRGIVHRDLKPENVLIFPNDLVRIADFGISRLATKTILTENPLGTLGYMAPEQAYGKASFGSDVFAAGILFYELLTGHQPEWPFRWPFKRQALLLKRGGEPVAKFIECATAFEQRARYRDAQEMLEALQALEQRLGTMQLKRYRKANPTAPKKRQPDTAKGRAELFGRQHRRGLELDYNCPQCRSPVAEAMSCCPWCGFDKRPFVRSHSTLPFRCGDCGRGVYGDWAYCPWCYTDKFTHIDATVTKASANDRRYVGKCANGRCGGKLMPFMRYCPHCHRKRRKPWRVAKLPEGCPHCHWSVSRADWKYCPWCGHWPLV